MIVQKKNILDDFKMSICGREVSATLIGDNTKEGGKEAYRASEVIKKLFVDNKDYDILTFTVFDRKDPTHCLWSYKLMLHGDIENFVIDMVGGEFLAGIPNYSE